MRQLIFHSEGYGSDGPGFVSAYRIGDDIEIVASEQTNGDAAVRLSPHEACRLATLLLGLFPDHRAANDGPAGAV